MPPVVELLYVLYSHRNVLMFCVLVNQPSVSKKVNESAVHVDEFSDEGSDVDIFIAMRSPVANSALESCLKYCVCDVFTHVHNTVHST